MRGVEDGILSRGPLLVRRHPLESRVGHDDAVDRAQVLAARAGEELRGVANHKAGEGQAESFHLAPRVRAFGRRLAREQGLGMVHEVEDAHTR